MARTGSGTRRPRGKTAGAGEQAGSEATSGAESGAAAQGSDPAATPLTSEAAVSGREAATAPEAEPATGSATESVAETDTGTPAESSPQAAPEASEAPETPAATDGAAAAETTGPAPQADVPEPERLAPPEPDTPQTAAPAAPAPAISPPEPQRRGGAVALVLGGVVAAAIGAGAALYLFPQGWQPTDTTALEARLAALEARSDSAGVTADDLDAALDQLLAPVLARLEAAEAAPPDLQPLTERLARLEAEAGPGAEALSDTLTETLNDTLSGALAPLQERITQLEGSLGARIEAEIAGAMEATRSRQAEQTQAIEAAQQDLQAAQTRLEARAALAELAAAAESGQPASAALATLGAVTDIPPALRAFADGIPRLRDLQASYPAAARAALAAAPIAEETSTTERLLGFLRNQTGARSLAPRDGDSTDAILSRAEALLRAADLPGALAEINTLPEGPASAMALWRAQAEARLAALAALGDVQTYLGSQ